jgi:uncharacterized protein YjcR
MARRYLTGEDVDKVAADYGVSPKTVRRWADTLGMDGEAPKRGEGLKFSDPE